MTCVTLALFSSLQSETPYCRLQIISSVINHNNSKLSHSFHLRLSSSISTCTLVFGHSLLACFKSDTELCSRKLLTRLLANHSAICVWTDCPQGYHLLTINHFAAKTSHESKLVSEQPLSLGLVQLDLSEMRLIYQRN